jgi:hypothetical protein
MIAAHTLDSLIAYVTTGSEVGGFLSAVLDNDLILASRLADSESQRSLASIACLLWNHAPPDSFGSAQKRRAWIEQGGLEGADAATQNCYANFARVGGFARGNGDRHG